LHEGGAVIGKKLFFDVNFPHPWLGNIFTDYGNRPHGYAITHADVAIGADPPGKHAIVTKSRAAGNDKPGRDQTIFADGRG